MLALVSAGFLVPACLVLTVSVSYGGTEPAPLRPRARCRREPLRSATNLAADLPAPGKAQAACDLNQDTLEAHRQIPGKDQPETMANASNLAADLLLENERAEWELPGGKLELGEEPADCVVREISEETGWKVTAGPLLDCWQYHISQGRDVVIVTYGCPVISTDSPVVSHEHKRAGLFGPGEVPGLVMPEGYKRSVAAWFARLNGQAVP
jgi:8-oxo-dGTP pyrophosphatase MutT (NUDIX family)